MTGLLRFISNLKPKWSSSWLTRRLGPIVLHPGLCVLRIWFRRSTLIHGCLLRGNYALHVETALHIHILILNKPLNILSASSLKLIIHLLGLVFQKLLLLFGLLDNSYSLIFLTHQILFGFESLIASFNSTFGAISVETTLEFFELGVLNR